MRNWPKERLLSGVVPSVNQIITSSGRSGPDPMVHGWPYFGPTTTLNAAALCAAVSSISAGQQRKRQVVDTHVYLYDQKGGLLLSQCKASPVGSCRRYAPPVVAHALSKMG
jgi:hypothetical protein